MTRHLAPAPYDFVVANLRDSGLWRAIDATNAHSADTTCSARTYPELP